MKMDKDNRKNYWNKTYVDYWKNKVQQANELIDLSDPTSTDKTYLRMIDMLDIQSTDTMLDVGCGYGRSLPYLSFAAKKVIGVDISHEMIKEAEKSTHSCNNVILQVSESESMSLDSNLIDKVICFAAFDAMYQKKALIEFNRICKIGGTLLVTGKNNYFMHDDEEAELAELGARKKSHPNYFTDVSLLIESMHLFGFKVEFEEYYLRRGDFSTNKIVKNKPEQFYEYMLLLKKVNNAVNATLIPEISKTYSQKHSK
jgi:ubiquinone/menaquinone biosynthesis C-methylase UbiE